MARNPNLMTKAHNLPANRPLRLLAHLRSKQRPSLWLRIGRLCDFLAAAVAITVLSPLLAMISLIVLLSLGRPVLFSQRRIGRWGEEFSIWKFRTMATNAPDLRNPDGTTRVSASEQGINRVGAFLRRTSLDELPQLANVLVGDMGLVGPRPELPEGLTRYDGREWRRLAIRPGLTSLAVIRGRKDLALRERRDLDVEYIRQKSFSVDLRIISATLRILLTGEGAR